MNKNYSQIVVSFEWRGKDYEYVIDIAEIDTEHYDDIWEEYCGDWSGEEDGIAFEINGDLDKWGNVIPTVTYIGCYDDIDDVFPCEMIDKKDIKQILR